MCALPLSGPTASSWDGVWLAIFALKKGIESIRATEMADFYWISAHVMIKKQMFFMP